MYLVRKRYFLKKRWFFLPSFLPSCKQDFIESWTSVASCHDTRFLSRDARWHSDPPVPWPNVFRINRSIVSTNAFARCEDYEIARIISSSDFLTLVRRQGISLDNFLREILLFPSLERRNFSRRESVGKKKRKEKMAWCNNDRLKVDRRGECLERANGTRSDRSTLTNLVWYISILNQHGSSARSSP